MCFGGSTAVPEITVPEIPSPPAPVGEPISTPQPKPSVVAPDITPTPDTAAVKPAVSAADSEMSRTGTGRLKKKAPADSTNAAGTGLNYSGTASPRGMSLNIQKQ